MSVTPSKLFKMIPRILLCVFLSAGIFVVAAIGFVAIWIEEDAAAAAETAWELLDTTFAYMIDYIVS